MRHRQISTAALAAFCLVAWGCAKDKAVVPGAEDTGGADTATGTGTGTGLDSDTGSGSDTGTGSPDGGDTDTGSASDTGTGDAAGCAGLDVVLAADAAAAGHLVDALRSRFLQQLSGLLGLDEGIDELHVAVIDGCPGPAFFHDSGNGGDCDLPGGLNWISSADADFADDLGCLMALPSSGGYSGQSDACASGAESSQPAMAAGQALSGTALDTNAGFLRDDALLLVVALTDTDESFAGGDGNAVRQALVNAKGGDAGRAFFLGLGGEVEVAVVDPDCDSAYDTQLDYDISNSANMKAVVSAFGGTGLYANMCHNFGDADPIATALAEMENMLDGACALYNP